MLEACGNSPISRDVGLDPNLVSERKVDAEKQNGGWAGPDSHERSVKCD